jgi:DNA-binding IclR family transcriptional regulator
MFSSRDAAARSFAHPWSAEPGVDALCAPVFDSAGNIMHGMAMGPSATFESDWDGKVYTVMWRCAKEVPRWLGYETLTDPGAA